jgi:hypothetical protein
MGDEAFLHMLHKTFVCKKKHLISQKGREIFANPTEFSLNGFGFAV